MNGKNKNNSIFQGKKMYFKFYFIFVSLVFFFLYYYTLSVFKHLDCIYMGNAQ